jgi:hypothetical protein
MVPLFSNQALGIALFSYDEGLYWGISSDWDALPDVHEFVEALGESFAELHRAATRGRSRRPKTGKARRAQRVRKK